MNVDLTPYASKRVCVACSGGRDSMALLHYLHSNAARYGITLSALNCDHGIRGEESVRDSAFVREYCRALGVPFLFFRARESLKTEAEARAWRMRCYRAALSSEDSQRIVPDECPPGWRGCDCIATAHHMNDNAETVLFNLARGSALSGMRGIRDGAYVIRPLIGVPRSDIESYVARNGINYVDDSTNFSDDYTRNRIRRNVLPALEAAVPGAAAAICRFSHLASEDEEYFARKAAEILTDNGVYGCAIARCNEPVIYKRAAICAVERFKRKDYTSLHAQKLFELQSAPKGKKFEFLGLVAVNDVCRVIIYDPAVLSPPAVAASCCDFIGRGRKSVGFGGQPLAFASSAEEAEMTARPHGNMPVKTLVVDVGNIPAGAVVRTMRPGDVFTKFGGGTKKLGDFFTDRKIPAYVRPAIPLVACGSDVLVVCGVEISEKVKVDSDTPPSMRGYISCTDYAKL